MSEFSIIEEEMTKYPHKFIAFKHNSAHDESWKKTVERCLSSWRLNAKVYRTVSETGFSTENFDQCIPILNDLGTKRLPSTPKEDKDITKNPFITDITEILTMKLIEHQHEGIVFPYPRVLHKELTGNQHKGIDLLGYIQTPNGHTLLIAEVMASVDQKYPATTVREHLTQLLDDTLNKGKPERLVKELEYVHDESDEVHKDVLNNFLIALFTNDIKNKEDILAVPVLVRPISKWHRDDWEPFLKVTDKFETAAIPSTLNYYAIECDCTFSELLDRVKGTAEHK